MSENRLRNTVFLQYVSLSERLHMPYLFIYLTILVFENRINTFLTKPFIDLSHYTNRNIKALLIVIYFKKHLSQREK